MQNSHGFYSSNSILKDYLVLCFYTVLTFVHHRAQQQFSFLLRRSLPDTQGHKHLATKATPLSCAHGFNNHCFLLGPNH